MKIYLQEGQHIALWGVGNFISGRLPYSCCHQGGLFALLLASLYVVLKYCGVVKIFMFKTGIVTASFIISNLVSSNGGVDPLQRKHGWVSRKTQQLSKETCFFLNGVKF